MTNDPEKENELARLARNVYGENAVEFLVGALSSVTNENQIETLLTKLRSINSDMALLAKFTDVRKRFPPP